MKKILCTILALAMIISMLPTTFAAVDAETGAITYEFVQDSTRLAKNTTRLETKAGVWNYSTYPTSGDAGKMWVYRGTNTQGLHKNYNVYIDGYVRTAEVTEGDWIAFAIQVSDENTYSISGTVHMSEFTPDSVSIYLVPATEDVNKIFSSKNTDVYGTVNMDSTGTSPSTRSGAQKFTSLNIDEQYKVGETSFYENVSLANGSIKPFNTTSFKERMLATGEYILIYKANSAGTTGFTPASLTLTPQAVAAEPTITVSAAPEEIVVGETAALSSVVTDSTEADVSASTVVTYTSESDCIAISGNIVTGVKEGTATITASATVDGKPVTDTIEIKVKSDVLILDFNTASEVTSLEDPNGTKNPVYTAYGDRSWAYLGTNISSGGHGTFGFIYLQANAYLATPNLEENEWIAFKVKAPKTAMYTISGEAYHYHNATTAMDMYIIPVSDFNPDYGNATGGVRTEATTFEDLALDNEKKIGSANIKVSRNDKVTKTIALTEPNAQLMRANQEYVLLLNASTGGAMTVTELALTPLSQEIPKEPVIVAEEISFVATSNVGEKDMMVVEAEGFEYDEFMDSIPSGTFVKVTAPKKEGYEFKHWVRGSEDNGVYISDEPSYSFTALTNTFITAIYENVTDEDDTAVVEFYNGNGQYLAKAISTLGGTVTVPEAAVAPTLTGFEFADQWKTEDGVLDVTTPLVKKLTRAVAQFNALSTVFNVTCGNDKTPLSYGEKKTFTSDDNVYWLRDNTIVGYGKSYTYAAWAETEITMAESGKLCPVVLLDDTIKDGARMIEYNAAGKDIVEVGILFGGQNVNIGSCNSKATSQYKNQHGQFTAKPYGTETHARGYMIYKDTDNSYKVVYSD